MVDSQTNIYIDLSVKYELSNHLQTNLTKLACFMFRSRISQEWRIKWEMTELLYIHFRKVIEPQKTNKNTYKIPFRINILVINCSRPNKFPPSNIFPKSEFNGKPLMGILFFISSFNSFLPYPLIAGMIK